MVQYLHDSCNHLWQIVVSFWRLARERVLAENQQKSHGKTVDAQTRDTLVSVVTFTLTP